VLEHCSTAIDIYFAEQLKIIGFTCDNLSSVDDLTSEEAVRQLNSLKNSTDFLRVYISFSDGTFIANDVALRKNIGFEDAVKEIEEGRSLIEGPVTSTIEPDKQVVIFGLPILKDGEIVARLFATIEISLLDQLFYENFKSLDGNIFLVNQKSQIICSMEKGKSVINDENFLKILEENEKYINTPDFRSSIVNDTGNHRYISFKKLNNWHVVTVTKEDLINKQVDEIQRDVIILGVSTLGCILLLVGYVIYIQNSAKNNAMLNEKCFHTLAEQSGDIIIDWDFERHGIKFVNNFEGYFGRNPFTNSSAEDAIGADGIHPEDINEFRKLFHTITSGHNVDDVRFRVKDGVGEFVWCSFTGVVIRHKNGKPFKAIGSLKNINEAVKKERELIANAEKDSLTGLLNKGTTEKIIKNVLSERRVIGEKHSLLMIDIDNFKEINDTLGHQFGDVVIKELSEKLRELFRTDDVVGRVGGDEFFVLMKNFNELDIVTVKAKQVCNVFSKEYGIKGENIKISASVGISVYPEHGSNFEEIYEAADFALYATKANGKNGYTIFSGEKNISYCSDRNKS
ncbi:MAG: diguanylate cyclase, partial [Anaerotignaceae bacterium]